MKKYEKPYVKEMGIEVDPILAGSQVIDSNDNTFNPTTGDDDDIPAKKIDVWE